MLLAAKSLIFSLIVDIHLPLIFGCQLGSKNADRGFQLWDNCVNGASPYQTELNTPQQ